MQLISAQVVTVNAVQTVALSAVKGWLQVFVATTGITAGCYLYLPPLAYEVVVDVVKYSSDAYYVYVFRNAVDGGSAMVYINKQWDCVKLRPDVARRTWRVCNPIVVVE